MYDNQETVGGPIFVPKAWSTNGMGSGIVNPGEPQALASYPPFAASFESRI